HKIYTMNFNPTRKYLVKSNIVVWFYVFLLFLFDSLVFVICLILEIDCDLGTCTRRLLRRLCLHLVLPPNCFYENYYLSLYTCLGPMLALGSVTFLSLSLSFFLIFCRFPLLVETF
ncbi:hypothetical protein PanWU01x14_326370, partial [Parasponia andersonii]